VRRAGRGTGAPWAAHMTTLDREYEDIVRRALVAAAESIEPAGDGLHRIRHRLNSPRSMTALAAGFTDWLRLSGIRFSVRLEPATETGRTALGQVRHLFTRPGLLSGPFLTRGQRPGEHPGRRRTAPSHRPLGRLRPAAAWLRPALAVAAVVVVVAGAVLAHNRTQQTLITPANSVSAHSADAAGPASGTAEGTASLRPWEPLGVIHKATATGGTSGQQKFISMLPAVTCSPKATPSPSKPVATGTATPTPTPSPTDTTQATPTPTPTPTTTPSVTPTPSDPGGGSSGSAGTSTGTQATTAAFIIPDGTRQPANTSCGGTSATATPKASAAASATS
jgi:hypothetical protein